MSPEVKDINQLSDKPRTLKLDNIKVGSFEVDLPDPHDLELAKICHRQHNVDMRRALTVPSPKEPLDIGYTIGITGWHETCWWEELKL